MNAGVAGVPRGYRSVLRHRPYRLWLGSSASASVGYSVYSISVVWLTYGATHSYAVVGLVLFAEYATYAATFLVAPLVDRASDQRTIYLACYPLQAVAAATLGVAYYRGFLSVPLLLGLIVLISVLWDLVWAAFQAAPRILLSPEEQFAAGGVAGVVEGGNSIVGYTVGGVLILVVGAAGGMFLYAGLLGVGAVLALGLSIRPGPPAEASFAASFRSGWTGLLSEPGHLLLKVAAIDAVRGFFTSGVALLITLVSIATFGASSAAYGVLFTAYVIGGVVAGLVLGWVNPRGRAGTVMVGALIATGAAFVVVGAVPPVLALAASVWLVVGIALSGYVDARLAFVRGSVDPHRLARVSSNLYLLPGITSSVGALVLGFVAGLATPWSFGLTLGIGFLAAGLLAGFVPGVRALRY